MYFPYFITYMAAGLIVGVLVFVWALKNGQFQDQDRARFLPLHGEMRLGAGLEPAPTSPAAASPWKRLEIYTLFFLAAAGLLTTAAVLVFSLISAR
jgi:cbb3-type cytochrome oxidase maturation protein